MSGNAQALVRSACSSDVAVALDALDSDPAVAQRDLASACVCGEVDAVLGVLAAEPAAASAATGPLGHPPLLYACFSRLPRVRPAIADGVRSVVAALLQAGADPGAEFRADGWRQTAVYGAAGIIGDSVLTEMLLAAGAEPDDDDPVHDVGEALYHAVEQVDPACAVALVRAGTAPRAVTHAVSRALDFADPGRVLALCVHGARARTRQLRLAAWRRRGPDVLAALIDAGSAVEGSDQDDGLSALRVCVRWGDDEAAAVLGERGADPGQVTDADRALGAYLGGRTADPGSAAIAEALGPLLDVAVDAGDLDAVRRLLDAGARVEGEPGREFTPIGVAAWRGRAEVVAELAARGAALSRPGAGTAIGAALHGSRNCHDPEAGPTMATVQEIPTAPYAATVRALLAAGAPVPETFGPGQPPASQRLAELGV